MKSWEKKNVFISTYNYFPGTALFHIVKTQIIKTHTETNMVLTSSQFRPWGLDLHFVCDRSASRYAQGPQLNTENLDGAVYNLIPRYLECYLCSFSSAR